MGAPMGAWRTARTGNAARCVLCARSMLASNYSTFFASKYRFRWYTCQSATQRTTVVESMLK